MRPTTTAGSNLLDGQSRHLDPKVRLKWAIERSVLWLVIGGAFVVLGIGLGNSTLTTAAGAVTAVVVVLAFASAWISYRYWTWAAHHDAIELSHGVFVRHLSVVPYHRIQQIDVTRDPLERMLGISTQVLRSAAATTDARLPGIGAAETDPLRHALLARAGVDDAV